MWRSFYEDLFQQNGRMSKASKQVKSLLLLMSLEFRDVTLWNNIIASMPDGCYDLPDEFFFDVRDTVLTGKFSLAQITEGYAGAALVQVC
jgi:hypothetical protein